MAHLWLIGMMGSGKTAAGSMAAVELNVPFYDTDADVVRRAGCPIAELWSSRGEEVFRDLEQVAVTAIATRPEGLVATGGGVVLRDDNIATMRASGRIVWMQASAATLAGRLDDVDGRPLLQGADAGERIAELLTARQQTYAAACDVVVDTEGRDVAEVARLIEEQWNAST